MLAWHAYVGDASEPEPETKNTADEMRCCVLEEGVVHAWLISAVHTRAPEARK